jgi:hypothetical protein
MNPEKFEAFIGIDFTHSSKNLHQNEYQRKIIIEKICTIVNGLKNLDVDTVKLVFWGLENNTVLELFDVSVDKVIDEYKSFIATGNFKYGSYTYLSSILTDSVKTAAENGKTVLCFSLTDGASSDPMRDKREFVDICAYNVITCIAGFGNDFDTPYDNGPTARQLLNELDDDIKHLTGGIDFIQCQIDKCDDATLFGEMPTQLEFIKKRNFHKVQMQKYKKALPSMILYATLIDIMIYIAYAQLVV